MNRKLLIGICALLIGATPVQAQEIKIGFPGPITGFLAFIGEHMRWGAEMAVDEINAKGGVLGRKLRYIAQDSKCSPADAVAAVEKMVSQDKVDVLMGDVCSGATLAVMPVAERAKLPLLVTVSTHPAITEKAGVGGNEWVFRTNPTDATIGSQIADLVRKAGHKRIAYISEDTDYGRGGVEILIKELGTSATTVSKDFITKTETDFLSVLTRYRRDKPDAIAVYLLDRQVQNFMKQYIQFGLKIPLVGRPPLGSALVKDLVKTGKFDGSWTVYPYYDAYDGAENVAFATAYKKRFGQPPHYVGFAMYEGIKIIADAITRAGSTAAEKVRGALGRTDYDSMLGRVRFDRHNQAHNAVLLLEARQGKLAVVSVSGG